MYLGIDISTTGAKALLVDAAGNVIASATTPLELSTPKPLWSEQNPADWWRGVVSSIRQVIAVSQVSIDAVESIGLTGQMHGLVLLDAVGSVLRPSILWNDQRTGEQCNWITETIGAKRLIEITGNQALTGFTAPKILWVRENEPEVYAQVAHILLPKDFIRFKLTGEYALDKAGGAGTLLFDLKTRDWSPLVVSILDIPKEWLPTTYEGPHITGELSSTAAVETGLRAGIPVVAGGGDQAAQAVGVGAVTPGIVALTLGTSGVVFASTDQPFIEPEGRLHAFCHAIPETWHLMGVMLSAAGSLRWYRDTFASRTSYPELLVPAAEVSPSSEGLLFLPYLTGERTPYPDPYARAAFVGLTVRHTFAHMTRAVLEGVAFGIRDSMQLVLNAGLGEITQVRISGGGAQSPLWRQILADVLDAELVTVSSTEGAAYGAALLAGVGAGNWDTVPQACKETIHTLESTTPNKKNLAIYADAYQRYRALYPALKPSFDAVAGIE